jgi:hypothetical protein
MRELVKNAYDSYLHLDANVLDDESFQRAIIIRAERGDDGVGRITVADNGIGLTAEGLKEFVQISKCKKSIELDYATGFRGLGSWAILGAGSKVIVRSRKKGDSVEAQLEIDVRKIYEQMGPTTSLDGILNNRECIKFLERLYEGDQHGTTVEIVCDSPPVNIGQYEINRLYEYTNPDTKGLRDLLVQTCPIPFSAQGGANELIHEIYRETNYVPTSIFLGSDNLERQLPTDLSKPVKKEIIVGGNVAAVAWVAENPKKTGEIRTVTDEHLLGGPSIQLMKLNVPIGPKGIFSTGIVRATMLNWYVGEVLIIAPDVLPDASGQDLRAGTARDAFIEALQRFYKKLEEDGERKSERINLEKKLREGADLAQRLQRGELDGYDRAQAVAKVAAGVKELQEATKRGKPRTKKEEWKKTAAQDPQVKQIIKTATKVFQETGYYDKYALVPTQTPTPKKKTSSSRPAKDQQTNGARSPRAVSFDEFQARLGRMTPQLTKIGLTTEQINAVLELINELVLSDQ